MHEKFWINKNLLSLVTYYVGEQTGLRDFSGYTFSTVSQKVNNYFKGLCTESSM